MHIHFLDPYRVGNSLIHRLDPRVKFILTLAFILTCALIPPGTWLVYLLLFVIILAIELISELGIGYVLKRALLSLPFILAALPIIFTTPGTVLFELGIGRWELTVSLPGLIRFLSIALKSWLSVQAAIVLAASTPFPELLVAMRAVRVPRLLVAIFGLMWRYLFVLADEVLRLNRARVARSSSSIHPRIKAGGSLTWRARVTGGMAGNLFLRALERSDRIYLAMVSRGYDGEVRTLPFPALTSANWLVLLIGLAILFLLLGLSFLFGF